MIASAARNTRNQLPVESIALAFGLQGRVADARLAFELWRERGGLDHARANYSWALLYARHFPDALKDLDEAARLLDEAWLILRDAPKSELRDYERVFNRNGRALIHYRNGELRHAERMLTAGITRLRQTRHSGAVHETVLTNNLGRVLAQAGDAERARFWLSEAVRIDPDFAEYHYDLALHHYRTGDLELAAKEAAQAAALNPTFPQHATLAGDVSLIREDWEAAESWFDRALEYEPSYSPALLGRARGEASQDRYASSRTFLDFVHLDDLERDDIVSALLLGVECDLHLDRTSVGEAMTQVESWCLKYPQSSDLVDALATLNQMAKG